MGKYLDKRVAEVLEDIESLITLAEAAKGVQSTTPTSHKNAGWVHLTVPGADKPSYVLLHVRENSPERVVERLRADKMLLNSFQRTSPGEGEYFGLLKAVELICEYWPESSK